MSSHIPKQRHSSDSFETGYQDAQFVTLSNQISSIVSQLKEIRDDPTTDDPIRTFAELAMSLLDDAYEETMKAHQWLA
jgi:hypothetical protein